MPIENEISSIVFIDCSTGKTFECNEIVHLEVQKVKEKDSSEEVAKNIYKGIDGSIELNINTETKQEIYKFFIRLKEYTRLLRIYNRVTKIRTKKKLINRMDKLV